MARELFVRELKISPRTAEKILTIHGLHEDEVKATIEDQGAWVFSWHYDLERGWRAILEGVVIREMACYVVLYPAEGEHGGIWRLGSAYPDETVEPHE